MRDMRRSMTEGGASVAREHSRYILHSWPSRTATPSTKGGLPSVRASVMDVPRKSCTCNRATGDAALRRRRRWRGREAVEGGREGGGGEEGGRLWAESRAAVAEQAEVVVAGTRGDGGVLRAGGRRHLVRHHLVDGLRLAGEVLLPRAQAPSVHSADEEVARG